MRSERIDQIKKEISVKRDFNLDEPLTFSRFRSILREIVSLKEE